MAKFGGCFTLSKTTSSKKFLTVAVNEANDGHIIITNGRNSASLVKREDQKIIQSWSTKHTSTFSCPVVLDHCTHFICAVQDNRILKLWPYEGRFENHQKTKFVSPILCLLNLEKSEPLIVFQNGCCQLLSHAISTSKDNKQCLISTEESIVWCDAAYYEVNITVFLLTCSKQGKKTLHRLLLSNESSILSHHSHPLYRDYQIPVCWCLQHDKSCASFLVLWSNGEMYRYSSGSETPVRLGTIPEITEDVVVGMDSLNSTHVALAKFAIVKDPLLEIWNTQFMVKIAEKVLPTSPSTDVQVSAIGNIVYLANRGIIGVPVNIESSCLANVVGMLSSDTVLNLNSKDEVFRWTDRGLVSDSRIRSEPSINKNSKNDVLSLYEASELTVFIICEQLLPKLREQGDIKTILNVVKQWKDIPESELVQLLHYCLSDEKFIPESNGETLEKWEQDLPESCSLRSLKTSLIKKLLCIPYTDVFLLQHLHFLSFKESMVLLQYLHYLLKTECLSSHVNDMEPSILQIIGWISLLLDSHFTDFFLSRDEEIQHFVCNLNETVVNKMKLYEELGQLEQLVSLVQRKTQFPEDRDTRPYSIEILHI